MRRWRRTLARIATFAKLPTRQRVLILEAFCTLAFARVWLLTVRFERVAGRLGEAWRSEAGPPAAQPPSASDEAAAQAIGRAVGRATRVAPFRAVCLQQAIAAKLMLRRRSIPSALHFGVSSVDGPDSGLRAHAWLSVGQIGVTGYPLSGDLKEIARFV